MLNKKLTSLVLAGAMAASLAVPAFAATAANTTTVTASYKDVNIEVTVPTTGTVTINPYGLPVVVNGEGDDAIKMKGQIVTVPMTIRNNSKDVDLNVGVTVTGTLGSGTMKFATAAPAETDTTKSAFVYFDIQKVAGLTGDVAADTDSDVAKTLSEVTWGDFSSDEDSAQVVVSAKAATKDTGVVLAKCDDNGYTAGSIAAVCLNGSVVASPKDGWTTKDTFKTTIAYTFTVAAESEG